MANPNKHNNRNETGKNRLFPNGTIAYLDSITGRMVGYAIHILWSLLFSRIYARYTGRSCKFIPSCSAYSILSMNNLGFFRGTLLTISRLRKCHNKEVNSALDFPPDKSNRKGNNNGQL